ncbi:RNase H domain-containing protein [Trichonephila clavipes]|nr:RNase H domain-containing protein [Trichonephila clavipes]
MLNYVEFREELLTSTPKHSSHPELLRQLALEVINDIPDQALIIYTNGSHSDTGAAERGIFSNTPVKISIRNSDRCSFFRSELIAISGALDHVLNYNKNSISILTDSSSSIKYLKNWPKIIDSTGIYVISKLARLGLRKQVCVVIPRGPGVPSLHPRDLDFLHAEIVEVEIEVVSPSIVPSGNFAELNRTVTCMVLKANDRRTSCPCHDEFRGPRSDYVRQRVNFSLPVPASPPHLLDRWGISLGQLFEDQDLVWEIIIRKVMKRTSGLNGYVNKQNCRIWSEANPQVYVETPLHPETLTV